MDTTVLTNKQLAMLGAMMGDALGVPHEFKSVHAIKPGFVKHPTSITVDYQTYKVKLGVYSDDFSQQLCVEQHFRARNRPEPFYDDLLLWRKGKYWVGNRLFDIGTQTSAQLNYYERHGTIKVHDENDSGNGSLMRVLPIAFADMTDIEMMVAVFHCSAITHNSNECINSCRFYCDLVRMLDVQRGISFIRAWEIIEKAVKWSPIRPNLDLGAGYVMSAMNALYHCMTTSTSYEEAVTKAIMLGGDTDTNACIVGGVAALYFGMKDVPDEWFEFLAPSFENEYVKELFVVQ